MSGPRPLLPVVILGCSWGPPLLGPASFPLIRELCTDPAFAVAGCICARPWLPPLRPWSSLGAHPAAVGAWRRLSGGAAEGLVERGGWRCWVFRESKSVSKKLAYMQQDKCIDM